MLINKNRKAGTAFIFLKQQTPNNKANQQERMLV